MNGLKTYIVAGAAILGAVAAYLNDPNTLGADLQAILTAVLGATIRHGVTTENAKPNPVA